jgi:hypothetical protein
VDSTYIAHDRHYVRLLRYAYVRQSQGLTTHPTGILCAWNPESRSLRDLTHNYSKGGTTNNVKG